MALPAIAPYPMPSADELPANRVEWTVDPARAVLLVHDLQNYFLSAYDRRSAPIPELLSHVAELKKEATRIGIPVIYTAQPGGQIPDERGLQQDFWGPGLPDDPYAVAIAGDVAPDEGYTVLTKWKYSGFVRTDLLERLREQGRDQIVITGVYAHIGVLMTACDAWMQDIQAFVVADAVAGFCAKDHAMALRWAAGKCAVVTSARAVFEGS
ncbi:isochorismatase family protein [Streptomyces sp. NBC_01260]|uniref:isochorismatase family protein n=1 Tax=Streptomyces sp. NBC_01260 TaxID=2903801 RepID=UPI002E32B6C5|nr:isochorismatase family protein [Streptomyces sp. NBC_01260]